MILRVSVAASLLILASVSSASTDPLLFWPQWRGPLGTGVAPHADPPIEWSETKNLRWKTAIPGMGHSTPAIWGDLVFLTTAEAFGDKVKPVLSDAPGAHDLTPVTRKHRFIVMAVNRKDGSIAWQLTVLEETPHEAVHRTASLASASPATEGKHVYAYFGSRGLYCLDFKGEVLWQKDFGKMRPMHAHGEGSSPLLHEDVLILNRDHEGQSSLHVLDRLTGEERWKVDRGEESSWTTPLVIEVEGKKQIIISGSYRVRSYDFDSGEEIWNCGGLSKENVVATPVYGRGLLYVGSTYDHNQLLSIRPEGAAGDISGTEHVAWTVRRSAPYVPSFLLYGDALYFVSHFQGILSRVDARTGEGRPGQFRLDGIRQVFASPLGAGKRVYVADRSGATIVLSATDKPETLAVNRLNDRFSASPISVDQELYLRGERHLYCLSESATESEVAPASIR